MKFSVQQYLFLLLQGLHQANSHYGFPYTVVNGVVSKRWEYIRATTSFAPNYDYSGPQSMCGFNATTPLFPVKTVQVAAGSTIGFAASYMADNRLEEQDFSDFDPAFKMYHDGPATAYLSKAPGELNDYKGDGEWFKIAVVPASDGLHWDYRSDIKMNIMNFTIPAATPPGKYLFRAEHLNVVNGATYKATEMFINCAHIEVTGSGAGTPGPVTHFPGAFNAKDSGIWLPNGLAKPTQPMDELKNWQGAGPKVWKG
ncbi:hypothetical protein CC86DRAFT_463311 [Ophiobolus disseminans]|uniref:lytic cellulose monooxygenase (C4-dehydrogenating) n=1 Tax=Ophiobolus disseminans TaxID=1469910 RepID=A0A6A7ADU1_9PLEO|nr:hypothetical protein CC86DRAFT_463311 [Ophiobolus disseminans]